MHLRGSLHRVVMFAILCRFASSLTEREMLGTAIACWWQPDAMNRFHFGTSNKLHNCNSVPYPSCA